MKKQNPLRRLSMTALLVAGIFLSGIGYNAHANQMGSGAGVTGSDANGGMLGSGTFADTSDNEDSTGAARAAETTDSENVGFGDIFEALAEIFS